MKKLSTPAKSSSKDEDFFNAGEESVRCARQNYERSESHRCFEEERRVSAAK